MACLAAPLVLWVPESLPACAALPDYNGLDAPIEKFGAIEAWRPEASMPGCNIGWLAWLGSLVRLAAGWLGWLAAAGGLLLAGCCKQKKCHTLDTPGGQRISYTMLLSFRDSLPCRSCQHPGIFPLVKTCGIYEIPFKTCGMLSFKVVRAWQEGQAVVIDRLPPLPPTSKTR